MTKRDELVAWARSQIGSNDRAGYWREALGYDPGVKKAWCGAFCLAGLHAVGLALHHKWGIDGSGMVGPLGLKRTANPKPGDIGYLDQPYQHHFIVTEVGAHTLSSVDGNQGTPGVQERHRAFKITGLAFYSIESLLRGTEPTPPYPTLRLGADSDVVATLQQLLNEYMAAGLVTDGKFGPKTLRAVQIFQRDKGLDADGVVGAKTWGAILT